MADDISLYGLGVEKRGPLRFALVDKISGYDISVHTTRRVAVMTMWRVAGDMRRSKCVRDGASSSPKRDR